jgi:predicted nucleotide-binding protein with TIR-like domain
MTSCSIFIGSSTEGLPIARKIEQVLSSSARVSIWKKIVKLGEFPLEALLKSVEVYDFGVIVLTPDDWVKTRGKNWSAPRDNLIFEIGLFMGHLGRERSFIVYDSADQLKIPSDFKGLQAATFSRNTPERISKRDVNPACEEIIEAVRKMGPRKHRFYADIVALSEHAKKSAMVRHPTFQTQLRFGYQQFRRESENWASGTIVARDAYEPVLLGVFENAKKEIFSTSVPQYNALWTEPFGDHLLKVQARKRIPSTRVFIFNKREDVTEADKQIFAKHAEHKVRVLVYYDGETRFKFPPEVGNDWTYVDNGDVIGRTLKVGSYEALWYFDNRDQRQTFLRQKSKVESHAEEYNCVSKRTPGLSAV